MNAKPHRTTPRNLLAAATTSIVLCLAGFAQGQTANNWTGANTRDWNLPGNWSEGVVPTKAANHNAVINTSVPNVATITQGIIPPADIIVGGAGGNGRLAHLAGDASTGTNNWMYVGTAGGTGVYNLADTSVVGPGISGYGLGSGSMNTNGGRFVVGGPTAGSTGTVNINTTGTLTVTSEMNVTSNGGTGVVNLENGTIVANDFLRVGYQAGSNGTLNMTGGTIRKQGNNNLIIGAGGGTGTATVSGGAINISNELWVGNAANSKGTLNFSGGTITGGTYACIGRDTGTKGTLNFTGGTWTKSGSGNFIVGDNATGEMNFSGASSVLNVTGEFWIANNTNGNGTMTFASGSITNSSWVAIGRGGNAVLTMTGGSWTKNGTGSNFIVGSQGSGKTGTMNMSGGTVTVQPGTTVDRGITWVGEMNGATGNLTLSGTAAFTTARITMGQNAGATGNLTLDGGTLRVGQITGGAGTANVTFNGGQVVASAASAAFIDNLDSANLAAGGLVIDSAGFNLASAQLLAGTGGLVKGGAGTLTLTAANTYAGATTVNGGKLAITTASLASGPVTLADATALGISQATADQAYSTTAATFGSSAATTLNIDLGDFAGNTLNAPLAVTGTDALALNGVVTINVADNLPVVGVIPLVSYTGAKVGAGSFALGTLPDGVEATLVDDGASLVALNVTRVNDPYWTGLWSTEWDTTTANWKDDYSEADTTYADGDPAMFDDRVNTLDAEVPVTLNATVAPGGSGVTFANTTKNYTLSGGGFITGATGLVKRGTGTVTVATINDYTGVTRVEGGRLNVPSLADGGVACTIGAADSSAGNLVLNGGTLAYTGPATASDRGFTVGGAESVLETANDLTLSGLVAGTGGGFVKTGSGALTLAAPLVSVGGAGQSSKVNGGTMVLDGTSGAGQTATFGGGLWVGAVAGVPAQLEIKGSVVNVGGWIALGRGNGDGTTSSLTATGATIASNFFTSGYNAGLANNDSDQIMTLTDTTWTNNGRLLLAESANATTVMTIAGASIVTKTGEYTSIGVNGNATLNLEGTSTLTVDGDFNVSDVGVSVGALNLKDHATLNSTGVFFVGKNSTTQGTVTMDGGTLNQTAYLTIGRRSGAIGAFHMNGGTLNQTDPGAGLIVGENGTGTFHLNGGTVNVGGGGFYLTAEGTGTGNGTLHLNGGTLVAKRIVERETTAGDQSHLFFNGGLLRAGTGAALDFISQLDEAKVQAGGAFLDSNGQTIAIAQDLLEDAFSPAGGLTKGGDGTLLLNGANTYSGTTTVTGGTLGGTGSVAGPLLVEASAAIAPGSSVGTFASGAATLRGTYACEIDGSRCDQLAAHGALDVSAATLAITEVNPASGSVFVIATYTGSAPAPFATVTGLPAGFTVDYAYDDGAATTNIALVRTATAYDLWVDKFFPGETDPAIIGKDADPDGDGQTNIVEFALDGDPASGAATGRVVGKVSTVGGGPALVLVLPVRTGATFSGTTEQVSAEIDGILYHIQGSDDLEAWTLAVSEVTDPADKQAAEADMRELSGPGWTYRTFRSPGTTTTDPADFLRAAIEQP